jgi:catechol 2,3-dioxygenase-like lactoylglutathione lyase family enzyme
MKYLLEVVQVPVSDIDRAKEFYSHKAGFHLDHDTWHGDARVVQLTPEGSACSIVLGIGLGTDMEPGSIQGLQLVVPDIRAAREELASRGLEISDVKVYDADGVRPSREDDELDNFGFAFFKDPDGNGWAVQQISSRGQASA